MCYTRKHSAAAASAVVSPSQQAEKSQRPSAASSISTGPQQQSQQLTPQKSQQQQQQAVLSPASAAAARPTAQKVAATSTIDILSQTTFKLSPFTTATIVEIKPHSSDEQNSPMMLYVSDLELESPSALDASGSAAQQATAAAWKHAHVKLVKTIMFICPNRQDAINWCYAVQTNVTAIVKKVFVTKLDKYRQLKLGGASSSSGLAVVTSSTTNGAHHHREESLQSSIVEEARRNARVKNECCGYLIRKNFTGNGASVHYQKPSIVFASVSEQGEISFHKTHTMNTMADVVACRLQHAKLRPQVDTVVVHEIEGSLLAFGININGECVEIFDTSDESQKRLWINTLTRVLAKFAPRPAPTAAPVASSSVSSVTSPQRERVAQAVSSNPPIPIPAIATQFNPATDTDDTSTFSVTAGDELSDDEVDDEDDDEAPIPSARSNPKLAVTPSTPSSAATYSASEDEEYEVGGDGTGTFIIRRDSSELKKQLQRSSSQVQASRNSENELDDDEANDDEEEGIPIGDGTGTFVYKTTRRRRRSSAADDTETSEELDGEELDGEMGTFKMRDDVEFEEPDFFGHQKRNVFKNDFWQTPQPSSSSSAGKPSSSKTGSSSSSVKSQAAVAQRSLSSADGRQSSSLEQQVEKLKQDASVKDEEIRTLKQLVAQLVTKNNQLEGEIENIKRVQLQSSQATDAGSSKKKKPGK